MVLPQLSGNSRERRRDKRGITGTARHPEEDSHRDSETSRRRQSQGQRNIQKKTVMVIREEVESE